MDGCHREACLEDFSLMEHGKMSVTCILLCRRHQRCSKHLSSGPLKKDELDSL